MSVRHLLAIKKGGVLSSPKEESSIISSTVNKDIISAAADRTAESISLQAEQWQEKFFSRRYRYPDNSIQTLILKDMLYHKDRIAGIDEFLVNERPNFGIPSRSVRFIKVAGRKSYPYLVIYEDEEPVAVAIEDRLWRDEDFSMSTKFYEVPISSQMGREILDMVNSFLNKAPDKLSIFESQTTIVFKNMIFYSTIVLPSEIKQFRDITANDPLFNHLIDFIQKYNLKFSFIGGEYQLTPLKFSNGVSAKYEYGDTISKAFAHGPMPSFILHEMVHFIYYQLLNAEERIKQSQTNKIMPSDREFTNILGKVRDYFKNRPDLLQVGLRSFAKGDVNNPNDLLINESFAYFIDRLYGKKPDNVKVYKKKVFEILNVFGVAVTSSSSTGAAIDLNISRDQTNRHVVPIDELKTGGIDFSMAMPIITQKVINPQNNFRIPLEKIASPLARNDNIAEWFQIEKMVSSGITPSPERIREYLINSCQDEQSMDRELNKAICCIAAITRLEEGNAVVKSKWKELLSLIESNIPVSQLQLELKQLVFLPK